MKNRIKRTVESTTALLALLKSWSCPVEQTFGKACSTPQQMVLWMTRWRRWCELRAGRCMEQCSDPRDTEAGFSGSDLIGLSKQSQRISKRPLANVWDIPQPCVPGQCCSWELTFQLCFVCFHVSKVSKDQMEVLDKLMLLKLIWPFKFLEL